ncbi:holo-ACP synthase [Tsukamurella ocularis]|uniref:holo-ACP synthase n=1 Tax=Tsukamurella ocularis TaxID=1970234 RepID=UPI0021690B63|nr:holo-ACP synthase [Tsukamurella ocularis]MCS3779663.1 holo-[acyl-carrier protein] synthase [Tsukamurella ocularis]MCS3788937.1 holo-[acyl-carrier protein] synthase [Tsukamurella ocularis]MCS3850147.1 holo-[acyl-carrier protein] synthase [Tsukamurella ocularis]
MGIDLAEVAGIEESLALFGTNFTERVFTPGELTACAGDARRLAARWAGKEAAVKALRLGPDVATPPREIELVDTPHGPEVRLHGGLAAAAREQGWVRADVSLTHTDHVAAAVVVVELAC